MLHTLLILNFVVGRMKGISKWLVRRKMCDIPVKGKLTDTMTNEVAITIEILEKIEMGVWEEMGIWEGTVRNPSLIEVKLQFF